MKIAFTTKGDKWDAKIDPRFGRTGKIFVYDEATNNFQVIDNSEVASQAHGVGPKTVQKVAELGVEIVITGNGPGGNAAQIVKELNLKVYLGAGEMTVKEAYNAYNNGELKEFE